MHRTRATSKARVWAVLLTGLLSPSPALAQESLEHALAKCASVAGQLERLQCFDDVTLQRGLSGPQRLRSEVKGTGKWRVSIDKNPIDDSQTVILALESESGQSRLGNPVKLVVRCRSQKTEMYIDWSAYLGDDSSDVYSSWKHVLTRIGSENAVTSRWSISTDNEATFAPDSAVDWLKRMAKVDTFLAQVTPYSENPVTAQFDVRGLAAALQPLMKTCNWSM